MTPGVDFLKLLDRDFGVDGRRFEFGMTEQLLDVADVRSAFEHVCGAGVTQHMARGHASGHFLDP